MFNSRWMSTATAIVVISLAVNQTAQFAFSAETPDSQNAAVTAEAKKDGAGNALTERHAAARNAVAQAIAQVQTQTNRPPGPSAAAPEKRKSRKWILIVAGAAGAALIVGLHGSSDEPAISVGLPSVGGPQ